MNVRSAIEDSHESVSISVAFNHDSKCFSVAQDSGFCIFNSDLCELTKARDLNGGLGQAEMLGTTNYMALVGGGKKPKYLPNKVMVWDDKTSKVVTSLDMLQPVRRVRLSRERIIVVLKNSVHVYKFAIKPQKLSVHDTTDNPDGLCCLSTRLLAFPGGTPGQVHLVELATGNVTIVPAHSSSLRAIEISPDGEILATASEQGTLIRIFRTSNGAKLAELRRGVDPARVFCLKISPNNQQIAVTSDKSTLHVFDIPHPTKPSSRDTTNSRLTSMGGNGGSLSPIDDGTASKWGILSKVPMLPRVFSDTYSFASATFELGKYAALAAQSSRPYLTYGEDNPIPSKGIIGWTSNHSLVVLGAGENGVWEKFILAEGEDGRRYCIRQAWKRYLS